MQALVEGVEYHPIGTLNLAVGPRVSNRDVPDVDPAILAVFPELVIVEIETQVCDETVGEPIAMHNLIEEVEYSVDLGTGDRLDLDPLGKLVDSHQNSVESSWHSWERANHVEPPVSKRTGLWYGDELVGWDVLLPGEELTSLALVD